MKNKPLESQTCTVPPVCEMGLLTCEENDVFECIGTGWIKSTTCEYGCFEGRCLDKTVNEKGEEEQPPLSVTGNLIQNIPSVFWIVIGLIIVVGGTVYWLATRDTSEEK